MYYDTLGTWWSTLLCGPRMSRHVLPSAIHQNGSSREGCLGVRPGPGLGGRPMLVGNWENRRLI